MTAVVWNISDENLMKTIDFLWIYSWLSNWTIAIVDLLLYPLRASKRTYCKHPHFIYEKVFFSASNLLNFLISNLCSIDNFWIACFILLRDNRLCLNNCWMKFICQPIISLYSWHLSTIFFRVSLKSEKKSIYALIQSNSNFLPTFIIIVHELRS